MAPGGRGGWRGPPRTRVVPALSPLVAIRGGGTAPRAQPGNSVNSCEIRKKNNKKTGIFTGIFFFFLPPFLARAFREREGRFRSGGIGNRGRTGESPRPREGSARGGSRGPAGASAALRFLFFPSAPHYFGGSQSPLLLREPHPKFWGFPPHPGELGWGCFAGKTPKFSDEDGPGWFSPLQNFARSSPKCPKHPQTAPRTPKISGFLLREELRGGWIRFLDFWPQWLKWGVEFWRRGWGFVLIDKGWEMDVLIRK